MPFRTKTFVLTLLALLLLPIVARAALFAVEERPRSWHEANWSSVGVLPTAAKHPDARLLVMTGRTGGLKGVVAVHSWIVLKRPNARSWTRYDVVGWGRPLRLNGWAADGRWYGDHPHVVLDLRGAAAEAVIPKLEQAIAAYKFNHAGDYRLWPGPNSNTFIATVLRAVPELGVTLPPNAIGKDFREGPYLGLTDSRTGVEANLYGMLSVKVGWVEGLELNVLGLVIGADLRAPALKLPGFGRLGVGGPVVLTAAPAS